MSLRIRKKVVFTLMGLLACVIIGVHFYLRMELGRCSGCDNFSQIIPKIIHQTAPADKNKWHEIWSTCQQSWKTQFPAPKYEYKMWTDEDLNDLMKNDFPEYYDMYKGYDHNIKRVDIARYFILYKHGGIYADMDYKCFKNFYDQLPSDKVSISESPYKENEHLQNALMISPKEHPFWIKVIEKATKRSGPGVDILKATGPVLVSDTYEENKHWVNVLPVDLYNPHKDSPENEEYIAQHYGTSVWV